MLAVAGCLGILAPAWAATRETERGGGATAPRTVALVRAAAQPLRGGARDYDALVRRVGARRFVLLGEQTHGSHELYAERARITRRLIEDRGFTGVALEADWADVRRVDAYVRGRRADADAAAALATFTRFPRWMWANVAFRDFVEWLRRYNEGRPAEERVGIYGLDLYGAERSAEAVVRYLESVDPPAALRARARYACVSGTGDRGGDANGECRGETQVQLNELRELLRQRRPMLDRAQLDELFSAIQNARVVNAAQDFEHAQFGVGASAWNIRDRHMADTIEELATHLAAGDRPAKLAVWAHNTHVGDARATEFATAGEWTLGQLVGQRHPEASVLVGFTTHRGTVTAASEWGGPGRRQRVRPALSGSYGALFHAARRGNFVLLLPRRGRLAAALGTPRLERAIGVVYVPASERDSHYFTARLSRQFDAVIHIDVTRAVTPLRPERADASARPAAGPPARTQKER